MVVVVMVVAKSCSPSCPRPLTPDAFLVLDLLFVPRDLHAEPAAAAAQLHNMIQVEWGKQAGRDRQG